MKVIKQIGNGTLTTCIETTAELIKSLPLDMAPEAIMKVCLLTNQKISKAMAAANLLERYNLEDVKHLTAMLPIVELDRTLPELVDEVMEKVSKDHHDPTVPITIGKVRQYIRAAKGLPPTRRTQSSMSVPIEIRDEIIELIKHTGHKNVNMFGLEALKSFIRNIKLTYSLS